MKRSGKVAVARARDQTKKRGGRHADRKEQKKRQDEPSAFTSMEFSLSEGIRCSWNSRAIAALFSLCSTVQLTFHRLLLRAWDALSDSRIQARYRYFLFLSLLPLCFPRPPSAFSRSLFRLFASCTKLARGFRDIHVEISIRKKVKRERDLDLDDTNDGPICRNRNGDAHGSFIIRWKAHKRWLFIVVHVLPMTNNLRKVLSIDCKLNWIVWAKNSTILFTRNFQEQSRR